MLARRQGERREGNKGSHRHGCRASKREQGARDGVPQENAGARARRDLCLVGGGEAC